MKKTCHLCFCLLVFCLLGVGCTTSSKTWHSFLLTPSSEAVGEKVDGAVPLVVTRVYIMEYLNRLEMLRRTGNQEIMVSRYGRWAGSLPVLIEESLNGMLRADKELEADDATRVPCVIRLLRFEPEGETFFLWATVRIGKSKPELVQISLKGVNSDDVSHAEFAGKALQELTRRMQKMAKASK